MSRKPSILVLYGHPGYPFRASVKSHIYFLKDYSGCHPFFCLINIDKKIPQYIFEKKFDIIIFHTTLLSIRWGGVEYFTQKIINRLLPLKDSEAVKIAMPQDEWIHTGALCKLINDLNVDFVFSVAPSSEWKKIYAEIKNPDIQFEQVLTGYLNTKLVDKLAKSNTKKAQKTDIGYRADKAPPWLGKHGYLKTRIAEVFNKQAPAYGFSTDISTDPKDIILGTQWLSFMQKCSYFIGVEGGSTVHDPDGLIWEKGTAYILEHPNASYEEIERKCFPGLDGNLQLIAISPRHLEACAAKTCQVLVEGSYNGMLKPLEHYIPVKSDFSNLNEVFHLMKDGALRRDLVDNAYRDIVKSGKYTYSYLAEFIIRKTFLSPASKTDATYLLMKYNHLEDAWYWFKQKSFYRSVHALLANIYISLGLRFVKQKMTGSRIHI